jgi:hypothetical protein
MFQINASMALLGNFECYKNSPGFMASFVAIAVDDD